GEIHGEPQGNGAAPATASRHQRGVLVYPVDAALRRQQADDLGVGARLAEQEALAFVAAFGPEAAQLGFGLDALGGDDDAEAFAEADDGTDDRLRLAVGAEIADEGLIDLDLVEGEAAQIAEAGITGAEIVHRDAHAERAQRMQ